MFQSQNNLEIVSALQSGEKHLRELARSFKVAPSTAMRAIDILEAEGVVDCLTEGRNRICSLKMTPEARAYVMMAEQYRLLKLLRNPSLRRVIQELTSKTNGELIILFGSYANDKARNDSDIDVYIETKSPALKQKLQKISDKLSIQTGSFDKSSELGREIIRNHLVIQNAERFLALTGWKEANS
jgi:predicted nucleotidyltransferase